MQMNLCVIQRIGQTGEGRGRENESIGGPSYESESGLHRTRQESQGGEKGLLEFQMCMIILVI